MRKIISIFIVIFLFCSLMFYTGCSNGYQAVESITLTCNGVTNTYSSYKTNTFSSPPTVITEEEYTQAISNDDNRIMSYAEAIETPSFKSILKKAKGKTNYKYVEPKLEGCWYYAEHPFFGDRYYLKTYYLETNYYFVYVKVVSDSVLKIKDNNGEITYAVSSYKLINF